MIGLLLGLVVALAWAFTLINCFNKMFQKQMKLERERCKKVAAEKEEFERLKISEGKKHALDLSSNDCNCSVDK